jgi:hypothetical protein
VKLLPEQSRKEKTIKSFTTIYVLLIVSITIITTNTLVNYAVINSKLHIYTNISEILNNLNESGTAVIKNLLINNGANGAQTIIQNNPKLYLDFNGDNIIDSLIIFTFINKSSTEIEFVTVSYILNIKDRGRTNHILYDQPLTPGSYRKYKILSNSEVLDLNYCTDIKFNTSDYKIKEIKRIEISTTQ